MRLVALTVLAVPLAVLACTTGSGSESGSSSGQAAASSSSDEGMSSSQETSSSSAAAPSSSAAATSSTGSAVDPCARYVSPTASSAVCHCPSNHQDDCQPNGCYGGWWCDLDQQRCVALPGCGSGSSSSSSSGGGRVYRVLFDAAHRQDEGNAYWIVDSSSPSPTPSNPGSEADWGGGISAWGYGLYASGRYTVRQLPSGTPLNHGGGGNGDLAGFDVFISVEPEALFTAVEQAALVSFMNAGGGVLMMSDHSGAVRCGRCVEATAVLNDFLVTGAGTAAGIRCDDNTVFDSGTTGLISSTPLADKIHHGPFGVGSRLAYHSGSSVSLAGNNVTAEIVIAASGTGMMALAAVGNGRIAIVGDSSPADDGTCSCSANLSEGWAEVDDRVVLLNTTAWLAHDGS